MGVIYKNGIPYGGGGSSEGDSQVIQVTSLPTPSIEYIDKIYQYIGTTDTNYTNGYFYKCVYDNDNSEYVWQTVQVSPADVKFSIKDSTLIISTT